MRRPGVLNVALVCGIAAFCLTLIRGAPPAEPIYTGAAVHPGAVSRTMQAAGAISWPPRSLEAWEAIAREDGEDYWAWLNVAERRQWAGKDPGEAWWAVLKTAKFRDKSARDYGRARYSMGRAAAALGMTDQAAEAFTDARAWYTERLERDYRSNRSELWHRLGWICRYLGDDAAALGHWQRAVETVGDQAQHNPQTAYNLACYKALLGETEDALRVLKHAAALGFEDPDLAKYDEDLAALRAEEDFPFIIERIRANHDAAKSRGPY